MIEKGGGGMSEWKECKLGDLITLEYGKSLNNYQDSYGKYPVYGTNGQIGYTDFYLSLIPSIIIGRKGAYRGVHFSPIPFFVIDTAFYVKPKTIDFNMYFLYNFLLTQNINSRDSGSAIPSTDRYEIYEIPILLPPLPEQRAIAGVLSCLDDKIDLLHRQNQTLEAMAEALFRQWFVEEADEGWEEKELNEILEFVVDNRGKTAPVSTIGIPLIATNCIKNDNIFPVYEKIRFISEKTYEEWFRAHPIPGDIIFVNKGTPGCVNLVPNPVDFCIAQDMIALRVNKNLISNFYLFIYLRTNEIQSQIINSSVGTTIPHLKKTDLLKFKILIPDKNKLFNFDEVVKPFFIKMNINIKQIRTLESLRNTLLPKLMSGEVRVKYD